MTLIELQDYLKQNVSYGDVRLILSDFDKRYYVIGNELEVLRAANYLKTFEVGFSSYFSIQHTVGWWARVPESFMPESQS